jgi:allantoinase
MATDFDLIIRNGTVVRPDGVTPSSIAIANGKIIAIDPQISGKAKQEINAIGLHIFPGLIDIHVHFDEPGRTDWEGIATGSAALSAGGGTCFFDMPLNSSPPVLDGKSFDQKVSAATGKSNTDFALWGGLTPNNLDHMEELADRGVIGFKAFMSDSGIDEFPRADDWTLELGMSKAAKLGLPVAVHAESQEMTSGKTAWMRKQSPNLTPMDWPLAREPLAEADAIQRAILLAGAFHCKLHIVHISNRDCVKLAHKNRHRADLTTETCPHYFMLTAQDVARIGPAAKCAPPIRIAPHHDQLWETIRDGSIDIIGSDHSPAPPSMKQGDFWSAWGGVAGVQSTIASLLTRQPNIPPQRVAQLIATTPAKRFNITDKGQIAVGFDADISLVDIQKNFNLNSKDLLDRHKLSPYVGREFKGVVHQTILRGQTIFADGKIVAPPSGRLIKPTRS